MILNSIRHFENQNQSQLVHENVNVLHNLNGWERMNERKLREKKPEDFILGIVVNRLRMAKGLTFEELAEAIKLRTTTGHNLTTGSATNYPSVICELADFFGVTERYLLRGEDQDREEMKRQIIELELKKQHDEFEEAKQISMLKFLEEENQKLRSEIKEMRA